jgi:Na+-transporting methylmalonyl-CoA/oxaloacetate decarboxylase gamma subunit
MSLGDQIVLVLFGFGIVLTVLALLWLVSASVGRLFVLRETAVAHAAAAAAGPPRPAVAPALAAGMPAAHAAAIAAAVAVVTGGRGRVAAVHLPAHQAATWAQSGRLEQYSSHRVRWDWAVPGPPHVDHQGAVHHEPPPAPAVPPSSSSNK